MVNAKLCTSCLLYYVYDLGDVLHIEIYIEISQGRVKCRLTMASKLTSVSLHMQFTSSRLNQMIDLKFDFEFLWFGGSLKFSPDIKVWIVFSYD